MGKLKIGITGQAGFIGSHLANQVRLSDDMELVEFDRQFFEDEGLLHDFANKCDVIVHLAGQSRGTDGDALYRINMELTEKLCRCTEVGSIFFGSTTHEAKDTPYHASKRDGRAMVERWAFANQQGRSCRTLLMANTYGPGSRPFYNSVVSTFCVRALQGDTPERIDDVPLQLIYVDDLCNEIRCEIRLQDKSRTVATISHNWEIPLPELWQKLSAWSRLQKDETPILNDCNEENLWHTLQSYRKCLSC